MTQALQTRSNAFNGLDSVPTTDLSIPRTMLIQDKSQLVKDKAKTPEGVVLVPGMIVNALDYSDIKDKEFVILNYNKEFVILDDDNKVVYATNDENDPELVEKAIWSGKTKNARRTMTFMSILDNNYDLPVMVKFSGASYKNAKKVLTLAKQHGKAFTDSVFKIGVIANSYKGNDFFELVGEWVSKPSKEQAVKLAAILTSLQSRVVKEAAPESEEAAPF